MIKGLHALLYTPKPQELRAFIRDKLGFPSTDVGEGWLIFDMPEAELGCHPSDRVSHSISFYCDDIHKTVEELKSRGVEFTTGISDEGFGMVDPLSNPRRRGSRIVPAQVREARSKQITQSISTASKKDKDQSKIAKAGGPGEI